MLQRFAALTLLFSCLVFQLKGQDSSVLDTKVTIKFDDVPLPAALRILNKTTQVNFSYNSNIVPRTRIISSYFEASLREILNDLLEIENLFFKEVSGNIVILKRPPTEKSVRGRVIDSRTKEPIYLASVFLDKSSLGMATNSQGFFEIDNVPDIRSSIVVSHVGYRSTIIPFPFENNVESPVIELVQEAVTLESVVVSAKNRRKRDKQDRTLLRRFKKDFLGRSDNAKACRIVNAHVLDFILLDDSTSSYSASAKDPLIIENMAMGYRISFKLEEFYFNNGISTRKGQARFTELDPRSRRQNRKWEIARERAYKGSDVHFLHSLLQRRLFEEGFRVNIVRYDSANSEYSSPLNPPELDEILSLQGTNKLFQYKLSTNYDIEITYINEYEDESYVKLYRSKSKSGNYKYTDKKSRSSIALSGNQKLQSYQITGNIDISSVPLYQKSVVAFRNKEPVISSPGYFTNVDDIVYLGVVDMGRFF